MLKKVFLSALILCMLQSREAMTQFVNLEGNNPDITEYVEANEENWNKPIMYVFYSNAPCPMCSEAMGMIYNIYEQYYADKFSYFEINYTDEGEFGMQESYGLTQPLSLVLVRIQDGQSRGYYKLENPQNFLDDKFYFKRRLLYEINNFLAT